MWFVPDGMDISPWDTPITRGFSRGCPAAARGHAMAPPPDVVRKWRRLICPLPWPDDAQAYYRPAIEGHAPRSAWRRRCSARRRLRRLPLLALRGQWCQNSAYGGTAQSSGTGDELAFPSVSSDFHGPHTSPTTLAPSQKISLTRSARLARKTWTTPPNGSPPIASRTSAA